jgi:hypothetical protein
VAEKSIQKALALTNEEHGLELLVDVLGQI